MRKQYGLPGSDAAGRLLVSCWCGENYVWVWPKDVREGRTGLCGAADCHAPDEQVVA